MSRSVTTDPVAGPSRDDPSPTDPRDVHIARLQAELAAMATRLESAEWALSHLGGEAPLEQRLHILAERAVAEAQRIREEARHQAERVVAEADQLRSFARYGAQQAAGQARDEIARQAEALLEDAARLRTAAQKEAAHIIRSAELQRELIGAQMEEISRMAQDIYADASARRQEVDAMIAQARGQADLILRQARTAAEARGRELLEAAGRRLKSAQEDADKMVELASQNVRRRRAELEEMERQALLRIKALEERYASLAHRPDSVLVTVLPHMAVEPSQEREKEGG